MQQEMGQRVASLEAKQDGHHEWLEGMARDIKELNGTVGKILETIAGNKGFFNGVVFTLAALGGIIGFLAAKAWDYLSHGGHA